MLKKVLLFILIILAFKGCTRDDLCPEGTATTPNLIITFNDIITPSARKEVAGLSIETNYENSVEVLSIRTTDSIAIPLNTNSDTTKYRFIRTTVTSSETIVDIDSIVFIYERRNDYVNRACGFKTEFNILDADLENEGSGNWIENVITIRDTVNDENSAHISILH